MALTTRAVGAAAAVLVLAAGACSGGPDDTEGVTMDVNEARAEMDDLLTRTAGALATTGALELTSDEGPSQCQSSQTGAVVDSVRISLVYVAPVASGEERAALDEVVAAWEDEGLELDRSSLDRRDPQIRGRAPGFLVRALAVPGSGQIGLTGDTDCLDPVGGGA